MCFAKALGEFGATITFVSNIPGENANHSGCHLLLYADAWWRYRRAASVARGRGYFRSARLAVAEFLARRGDRRGVRLE